MTTRRRSTNGLIIVPSVETWHGITDYERGPVPSCGVAWGQADDAVKVVLYDHRGEPTIVKDPIVGFKGGK